MRLRKTRPLVTGLGVLGVMALAAWAGNADEEKVTLDQVPAAVKATILREAGAAKITEIEREVEDGKVVYEAEVLIDGKEFDIEVAADGALLGKEVEDDSGDENDTVISIDELPPAAHAALIRHAGKHEIAKVERERDDGTMVYEAEWVVGGRKHEAKVSADGTLVELEENVDPTGVPTAVRAVAAKRFPAGTSVEYERKMMIVYELTAMVNGREMEVIATPTGQVYDDDGSNDGDD